MKKKICCLLLICIALLMGSFKEETFEDFFHATMKKMHKGEKDFSYSLIYKKMDVVHKNDAIAIFLDNNAHKETIFIGYFEKENNKWHWKKTRGAEWDSLLNWSSMKQVPYIYSGAMNDNSISEVYAGEEPAKIIEVEGDKRFWYAISEVKDVKVQVVKNDGAQEVIKRIRK